MFKPQYLSSTVIIRPTKFVVNAIIINLIFNFQFLINTLVNVSSIVEDIFCECVEKPDFCSPPETDCPNGKVWSYGQCGCTCRKNCPKPFLQDETTCACDCLVNNRVCKNIQRGRKDIRLSSEQCE